MVHIRQKIIKGAAERYCLLYNFMRPEVISPAYEVQSFFSKLSKRPFPQALITLKTPELLLDF